MPVDRGVSSRVSVELRRLAPGRVRVLGGTAAVPAGADPLLRRLVLR